MVGWQANVGEGRGAGRSALLEAELRIEQQERAQTRAAMEALAGFSPKLSGTQHRSGCKHREETLGHQEFVLGFKARGAEQIQESEIFWLSKV